MKPEDCQNLDDVRGGIDAIDRRIVELLTDRSRYIERAARLNTTPTRSKCRLGWRRS